MISIYSFCKDIITEEINCIMQLLNVRSFSGTGYEQKNNHTYTTTAKSTTQSINTYNMKYTHYSLS